MIPSLASKLDDRDNKQGDLFAYVSIEDISDPSKKPKPLRGQILKWNLSASKLVPGAVLREVGHANTICDFFIFILLVSLDLTCYFFIMSS